MNIQIDSGNKTDTMNASDRSQYDVLFSVADLDRDGKINGLEGFNYFAQSGLPRDVLARIWTLADVGSKGHLTQVEFRVATHLVFGLRRGEKLPLSLSTSLLASAQDVQPQQTASSLTPDWETSRGKAAEMMKKTFSELEAGRLVEALEHAQNAGAELIPHAKRLYKELEICRAYTQALEILIESKACDEESATVLSAALARFLGEIQLQPKHQAVCLRMSIAKNSAVHNYGLVAKAIKTLMVLNPAETAGLQPRLSFCVDMKFENRSMPDYECYHCARSVSPAPAECTHCGAPITVTYLLEQRKLAKEISTQEIVPQDVSEFDSGLVVVHHIPVPKLRSILKGGKNWIPRPSEPEEEEDEGLEKSTGSQSTTKKGVMMGGCQTKDIYNWMESPVMPSQEVY